MSSSPGLAQPLQPFRRSLDSFHFCHGLCQGSPEPGPASHFGGIWPSPSVLETARFFPPVPLILTSGFCSPLPDGAFAAHSPCPGSPRLEMLYPAAPPTCPSFSGQDAFSRDGRWGPILVIVTGEEVDVIRYVCSPEGRTG